MKARPFTELDSRRRVRIFVGAASISFAASGLAFLVFGFAASESAFARSRQNAPSSGDASNAVVPDKFDAGSGTLFVPTLDLDSPSVFSSVDAARRNRPPKPTKIKEDLFYPEGFLTTSRPTPEPTPAVAPSAPRPRLNPASETTPIAPPAEPEAPKKTRGDQILFFASSIALAALGLFVYFDYRYRDRLKFDLARNARLCSSGAVAADFEDVLAKSGTPSDASYVDPELDADPLFFDASFPSTALSDDRDDGAAGGASFDANDRFFATGADLKEENFDFAPGSIPIPVEIAEPREDFVVGEHKAPVR